MNPDNGTSESEIAVEAGAGATTTADVFRILGNRRRRYAILFFLHCDPTPDLRDLARKVAAWENEKPADRVTTEERRRVHNALQQFHLPKMDAAGVIEYDPTRHAIESTGGVSVARPYLEVVPGTSLPWCLYYLAFGAVGVALSAAAVVGAIPIRGPALALAVSVVLVASGAVHAHSELRGPRRGVEGDGEDRP